jgi:hypothetical protein
MNFSHYSYNKYKPQMYHASYKSLIIKKNQTSNKNCARSSGTVKAHSETKMKSPLLETIISAFTMAVQILDIV